jgi:D-threo-aldose 1-dehydrogenase
MLTSNGKVMIFELPQIIFGTSSLGNLYTSLPESVKLEIVKECLAQSKGTVLFDSAGKYGVGLALETLGKCLNMLKANPQKVVISNKLGWFRTPLTTPEPTFEKDVWMDLKHDAVQMIGYEGMLRCFDQGNELLDGYIPQMVSVHDPDEYLAAGEDDEARYNDILDAYRALADLKKAGKVTSVGIGVKDWQVIARIAKDVKLYWVMIANSMTVKSHPAELVTFMRGLAQRRIPIINSAVFHSGFLTGGDFYDYKLIKRADPGNEALFRWRDDFFGICKDFNISPAIACVQFAFHIPGVKSVALNTADPKRVKQNIDIAGSVIPGEFWTRLADQGLIKIHFPNN